MSNDVIWMTLGTVLTATLASMLFLFMRTAQRQTRHSDMLLDRFFRNREDPERAEYERHRLMDLVESLRSFQVRLEESLGEQPRMTELLVEQLRQLQGRSQETLLLEHRMRLLQAQLEESLQREPHHLTPAVSRLERASGELQKKLDSALEVWSKLPPPTISTAEAPSERILSVYRQVSSAFAHSIKTPLFTIDSALSNLRDRLPGVLGGLQPLDKETSSLLLSSLENAAVSLGYIRQLLGRGAGFLPGQAEAVSLAHLTERVIRIVRSPKYKLTQVEVSLDELPKVKSYPLNLMIALTEVIENAFEATGPSGSIDVVGGYESGTGIVRINVSNTGPRIAEDDQEKIFQGSFSTRGAGRGSGLELARNCLRAVGGDVILIESDDRGTTFEIRFKSENGRKQ